MLRAWTGFARHSTTLSFQREWILLVRTIPNEDKRIIYVAEISDSTLCIPSVTMKELEGSVDTFEVRKINSGSDSEGEDDEDDDC